MSKTVNTILTVAIVFSMAILLLYGYCATQKLDEKKEAKVNSSITKHINYKGEKPVSQPIFEEQQEQNSAPDNDEFEAYIEEEDEDYYEEPPVENIFAEAEYPVSSPAIIKNLEAAFLVIAGSFQNLANAETKVKQLKNKGMNAQIVHLNNSKLHAICIAKADTEKEAKDTMATLKAKHHIKAYVYKVPQKD